MSETLIVIVVIFFFLIGSLAYFGGFVWLCLGLLKSQEELHRAQRKKTKCDDCGGSLKGDKGPSEGWQLEDGRQVCHRCCVKDTRSEILRELPGPRGDEERVERALSRARRL